MSQYPRSITEEERDTLVELWADHVCDLHTALVESLLRGELTSHARDKDDDDKFSKAAFEQADRIVEGAKERIKSGFFDF